MFHFRRAGALIAATTTTAVVLTATPFAAAAEAEGLADRRVVIAADVDGAENDGPVAGR